MTLTTDQILEIEKAVDEIGRNRGYGWIVIQVDKGVPKYIIQAKSVDILRRDIYEQEAKRFE
jgi:hypothetical protein